VDTVELHSDSSRVLWTIRDSTAAVDASHLHSFPHVLLEGRSKKVYFHSSVFRGRKLDAKWIAGTLLGLVLTVVVLQNMVVRHSVYLLLIGFSTESQGRLHQSCGLEHWLRCHRTFLALDILAFR
jgi:hypothetical protein